MRSRLEIWISDRVFKTRRTGAALKRTTTAFLLIWFALVNVSVAGESRDEFDKALRLLNNGRFQEAAAAFQKVTQHDPNNAEAWFFSGQSWFGSGRCQDALNAHEEAIHVQPAKGNYWVGKANSLLCLGRTDDSLKAYEKALELDKNLEYAWYGAARCYALKAEKETALKRLGRAIELNSRYKNMAYRDRSFRNLSNETDFKKLIEP